MPTLKFNRSGFGTRKPKDDDWFMGNPIKSVEKYLEEYEKAINYVESHEGLEKAYTDSIKKLDKKDKAIKAKIAAIRIAALRKADQLDINTKKFDVDFENKLESIVKEKNIRFVTTGYHPQEKKGEKRKRDDDETIESEKKQKEDEETKEIDMEEEEKEMDIEEEKKKPPKRKLEPVQDADQGEDSVFIDEQESTKAQPSETEGEAPAQAPVDDSQQETKTDDQDQSILDQEQSEEQPTEEQPSQQLEEIPLTHPDDIQETSNPIVQDPVESVETEITALPDDVVPQGQDDDDDVRKTIMPQEFNQQQQELTEQKQQEQQDLPDYEDIDSDYEDKTIEEGEDKPHSYLGFDNAGMPVTITHKPTPNEVQDIYITTISNLVENAMDVDIDDPEQIERIVETILTPIESEPEPQEQDKEGEEQPTQSTTDEEEKVADNEEEPRDMEVDQSVEQEQSQVEQDVEFAEPSRAQLRAQEADRKKMEREERIRQKREEKERVKKERADQAMDKLHDKIFGQQPTPIVTDEDEAKQYRDAMKIKRNRVLQYITNIVTSKVQNLIQEKQSIIGQIRSGHAKSEFSRQATDRPITKEQKEIRESVIQQEIRDTIEAKQLQRTSDILAEVADYTAMNRQRIQENINPRFAISKYIYPSYRDPDTYNIVKYRSDADGNVIIDKRTGHPIIESISAVDRDDTRKLLEQKQAVDSTDTPSPYFPLYGKPARRYFSKLEYNYLGRMFQGPGGKHRGSIPKPTNLKGRVKELIKEMSSSLELKETSVNKKDLFKQWMELEVLKNSYQRYNQFADYQYVQDKRELGEDGTLTDPDAMESAGKLLQNITVQKLLDLLASQKQKELQELPDTDDRLPGTLSDLKDKQQEAEIGPDEMDVSKNPEQVGADVPQEEEETKQSEVDINAWAKKADSQYQMQPIQVYRHKPFPAFGGDMDDLTDL